MSAIMEKYLAKLIFNIAVNDEKTGGEFHEQTIVVTASGSEDAFFKARKIGKQEESTFLNKDNDLVNWQFIDVAEVYALDTLRDGEQVYSKTIKEEEPADFISYIRRRAMEIQIKNLTFV